MSDSSSKKFVPFSVATNQFRPFGAGPQISPDLVEESEPDYKGLLGQANSELEQLKQQLQAVTEKNNALEANLSKAQAEFTQVRQYLEASTKEWTADIKESVGTALISALTQVLKNPTVLDLALSNRLSEALSDLSEKKRIRVLVAPQQVETTQRLLSDTPLWEVVASDDVRGGAVFQLEKERWDTRVQLAIDETIKMIQAWIDE